MNNGVALWRLRLGEIFENRLTHNVIASLIFVSILTLGLETSESAMAYAGHLIYYFNRFVIILFAVEIVARILAHGPNFFKDPWHVFDFIVVAIALLSFGGYFQIFRVLRIIWFLRMSALFQQVKHLIDALIRAIPNILSAMGLLALAIYVFAVIGTAEYGAIQPQLFGDVYTSMGTIVQSVLMEHTWSEHLEALHEHSPHAWVYIVPMIIILNFLLLHLVLAIILGALHNQYEQEQEERKNSFLQKLISSKGTAPQPEEHPMSAETQCILHELGKLREEIKKLKG
jgi:voltage-gated sodium channel